MTENAADTDPPEGTDGADSYRRPGRLFGRWYYDTYTVPYEQNEHWTTFFGKVADAIVAQLRPRTVLDAGCAKGILVAALRERGVEAHGFDVSEVAIADAVAGAAPYVRVGSLTDPVEGRYDLVTCIEVIEHLDPTDTLPAVANLCAASDRVLLSSTPGDFHEPTHVNVQPPERWSQLFATHGLYRNLDHDASYLSPWAALYERTSRPLTDTLMDYDRAWWQLRTETVEQRRALLDLQGQLERLSDGGPEGLQRLRDENEALQKELLRLRDAVIGKDAELGHALGRVTELDAHMQRYVELEKRLNDVLASTSWRLMWLLGTPIRKLRERRR